MPTSITPKKVTITLEYNPSKDLEGPTENVPDRWAHFLADCIRDGNLGPVSNITIQVIDGKWGFTLRVA